MTIFLAFLYLCGGAAVTFSLYYLYQKEGWSRDCYSDESAYCVVIGIFWPIAAPFAFAVFFAKKFGRDGRKHR